MTVNKRLNQIVWQRYKWFIALFVALIVGVSMVNTINTVNGVKEAEKTTTYQQFVMDTKNDAKEQKVKANLSQTEYKKYQAGMGYQDSYSMIDNSWSGILVIFMIGMGLFTSLYDLKTKFNEFIFSSGFSRRHYFWKRASLILWTTLITILISMVADVVIAKLLISSNYFHISESFLAWRLAYCLAGYISVYAVGTIVGILVNGVLAATITAIGFFGTYMLVITNFVNNGLTDPFVYSVQADTNGIEFGVQTQIATFLILAALMMWAASYFFNNLSLEQDGPYLQFNYLKKPLLIFVTLYIGFIIGGQGRGYTKLSEMIKVGVITGIITFIVAYIVIYRPQNVWQKIQNKFSKNKS
ncbi:hypothetical protein [Dellaglioa carnosa]|uniref:ABC transporter permease n=1 Tax=Dellaglioa carnosa TaxID=2995136 RepID=A0ABT4JPB7_9LACO|nr:hypothetical protein [Dellaglioa carnosa]MCZ2491677.1 hypothetical protein [Dellaglioa carnosa]MCZ2494754.1 hypothetical protein [Dellaglioa carnosa]MDK1731587.1 hypothetical protein [Dellaglioa carnosa]